MRSLKKIFQSLVVLGFFIFLLTGCAGVDCPLTNVVYSHWSFYSEGKAVTLTDTLYVYAKAHGKDTLLINKLYNASTMNIPFSYYQSTDTFVLEIHQKVDSVNYSVYKDQIIISKENLDHFNNPECGIWHEHSVTGINNTSTTIDSIQVVRPKIDTNETENFRIYFK